MADQSKFPEHEKLEAIQERSQAVGEFLDWLQEEKDIILCDWDKTWKGDHTFEPIQIRKQTLIAEFFEINEKRLEDEKQAMLDEVRSQYA